MRRMGYLAIGVVLCGLSIPAVCADDETKRVVGGVLTGLLGGTPQSPDAAYTAQERDRLVSLLRGGEYVTSRQGEPIDLVAYGIPLTRAEHVYTAKPIPPSQTRLPQR